MKFKRVFRGYDIDEVERYISETADNEKKIRLAQRERIDELSDENYALRQELNRYKADEQAISESLVASRNFAQEVQLNAEEYADKVLVQAKKFYATWQAYSQTLVSTLTPEELKSFNDLQKRLEKVINGYRKERETESDDNVASVPNSGAAATVSKEQSAESLEPERESGGNTAEDGSKQRSMHNPIAKVENAAEAVIDLRELTRTEQTLEELCADLGLIGKG